MSDTRREVVQDFRLRSADVEVLGGIPGGGWCGSEERRSCIDALRRCRPRGMALLALVVVPGLGDAGTDPDEEDDGIPLVFRGLDWDGA